VTFPADAAARITATHGVQLCLPKDREAQFAEAKQQFEQLKAHTLPNFAEIFGDGWVS